MLRLVGLLCLSSSTQARRTTDPLTQQAQHHTSPPSPPPPPTHPNRRRLGLIESAPTATSQKLLSLVMHYDDYEADDACDNACWEQNTYAPTRLGRSVRAAFLEGSYGLVDFPPNLAPRHVVDIAFEMT